MPLSEESREAYARGEIAGKVDARLEGHDDHFARINVSIDALVLEVRQVMRGIQRLEDKFEASEKTVVTTAAALKDAKSVADDANNKGWSPLTRWSAGIGILVALVGVALAIWR